MEKQHPVLQDFYIGVRRVNSSNHLYNIEMKGGIKNKK